MKKLLKTYNNETIYILGLDVIKEQETFSITDDYISLQLNFKDEYTYIETVGLCFILNENEFNNYKNRNLIDSEDADIDDTYCVQIKDYTGEIYLDIINDDTNESVFQEADNFYEDGVLYQTSVELNDIYWTLFITLDCSINKIKKIPFGESYEI